MKAMNYFIIGEDETSILRNSKMLDMEFCKKTSKQGSRWNVDGIYVRITPTGRSPKSMWHLHTVREIFIFELYWTSVVYFLSLQYMWLYQYMTVSTFCVIFAQVFPELLCAGLCSVVYDHEKLKNFKWSIHYWCKVRVLLTWSSGLRFLKTFSHELSDRMLVSNSFGSFLNSSFW